jgi:LssY C-terminus
VLSAGRFSGDMIECGGADPCAVGIGRSCAWLCLLVAVLAAARPAMACDEVPAGTVLWVQLVTHVSSDDAKPGMRVEALLEQDVACEGEVLFPMGTHVEGEIRHVQKVGWGIRHETAAIDLQFDRVQPQGDGPTEMSGRVMEVENARESVKNGVIHGIRATDTPQGTINSRLKHLPTWNPYSDAGLIVFKVAFPIFPEPEIYYGPGTEFKVVLASALIRPAIGERAAANGADLLPEDVPALDEMAQSEPERTYTKEHRVADVTNVALVGTQEQVESAFQKAGWVGSDPFSRRAFVLQFAAVLNSSSYVRAPMMPMLVDEMPPEMTFQKSLNSYAKRDHVRLWKRDETYGGEPIWLGAATHDVGASLSLRHAKFVHHIDPDIDQERAKVIRDLRLAGCVESVVMAPRPSVPALEMNATGDGMHTDGEMAVVRLRDCSSELGASLPANTQFRPGNKVFRYVRNQILIFRSDIWRANIIYGVYDLGRMLVSASRRRPTVPEIASSSVRLDAATPKSQPVAAVKVADVPLPSSSSLPAQTE